MLIWRNMKTVQTPDLIWQIYSSYGLYVCMHFILVIVSVNRVLYGITTNLSDRWLLRLSLLVIPAVKSHKR